MALSKADWQAPAPLWQNGPVPGAFYHFPGNSTHFEVGGFQRSQ